MKKIWHVASGIAAKALSVAVKLAKKLAHMAVETAAAAVTAAGKAVAGLLGKAACGVGKKVQRIIPPFCKIVMIASAAVAVLSCVGWLVSRKKFA